MEQKLQKDLLQREHKIRETFEELWKHAGSGIINPEQAQRTLDSLYERTLLDIVQKLPKYASYFPTNQCYPGRLSNVNSLWWVDHATGGINGWGTLAWFSSRPRKHVKIFDVYGKAQDYALRRKTSPESKDGKYYVTWTGPAGASTHFVVFADGTPFMLLPLNAGCWGEPKRNGDAIQIEMVNPLICTLKGQQWHFWAGKIPDAIVQVQRPELLEVPFRGVRSMMPYTWEQIVSNIKLKRLCVAATQRMSLSRMSQHTDWRESKFDMGPLWPFDLCNKIAYEPYPIEEYSFFNNYVRAENSDAVANINEVRALEKRALSQEDDHDVWDADTTQVSVMGLQNLLIKLYGPAVLPKYGPDGSMGDETVNAVRHFQTDWNRNKGSTQRLKIDGVAGIQTCKSLMEAIRLGSGFRKEPLL